jgi:hypothetical protein
MMTFSIGDLKNMLHTVHLMASALDSSVQNSETENEDTD